MGWGVARLLTELSNKVIEFRDRQTDRQSHSHRNMSHQTGWGRGGEGRGGGIPMRLFVFCGLRLLSERQSRPFAKPKLRYKPKETACTPGCSIRLGEGTGLAKRNVQDQKPYLFLDVHNRGIRSKKIWPVTLYMIISLFIHKFIYVC